MLLRAEAIAPSLFCRASALRCVVEGLLLMSAARLSECLQY